ncbi:MAG TPA: hypothetical protein VFH95_03830 [Candidatus Kapabacteria bacterium]|nr:hypothetical protein [Candidatus Kapabacteria bacterium]
MKLLIFFLAAFFIARIASAQWVATHQLGVDGTGPFDTLGNKLFACGGDGPPVWTSDFGETWNYVGSGLPAGVNSDGNLSITHVGNVLLVGTGLDFIYYSTDSGASWNSSKWTPDPGWPDNIQALFAHDGYVFAGGGLFRSSDSGRDWEYDTTNAFPRWYQAIYSFAGNDSVILGGNDADYVLRSTDNGDTWDTSRLTTDLYVGDLVDALTIIGNVALAGTSGGLYRSTNLGRTWIHIDTSIFNYGNGVLSLRSIDGVVVAGTHGSISLSRDSGLSWEPFGVGLPSDCWASSLGVADRYLFAGINSVPAVYRRPISDLSGVANTLPIMQDIRSYPNPFSQSTEITFTSEAAGYAEVSIINLLGAEVAHLFSGELAAGEHSFAWSKPTGLPDGMYECLVRMNGRVETLPVVLAR